MRENRKSFRKYLHCAILLVSLILGIFGIFGYIHFADGVEQLISDNLPYGTLSIAIQILLCLGILFTYPLQMFPVVEITENFFFKQTKERSTFTASFNSENSSLRAESPRIQYASLNPGNERSDDESYDTGESSEDKSAEELSSITRKDDSLLVKIPPGICSCDMVSD